MTTAATWTIAEVATKTGLSVDTLRYYERDGVMLQPVARSSSGHRRYLQHDLDWIEMVTRLRSTGMPIRDVRHYTELVRAGSGNETERLELLQSHRDHVRAQLTEVKAHLEAIDIKINIYVEATALSKMSA